MKRLSLALLATLLLATTASAQQVGSNVVPRAELKAWNQTPGGLLNFAARSTGVVTPASKFKIVENKSVPTGGGWDVWVRLQPVSQAVRGCEDKGCWVYWGKKDGARQPNLVTTN